MGVKPDRATRAADHAGGFLSLFCTMTMFVAGKAALFDREPWTLWLPLLGMAAVAFAAMTVLARYVTRQERRRVIALLAEAESRRHQEDRNHE